MTNKQLSQFFASFAASTFVFGLMAAAASAQYQVTRTETGAVLHKICAKTDIQIRKGISTTNPWATLSAFPIENRPVVGTLRRNQCRYVSDAEIQYHPSGGQVWVNIVYRPHTGGWVPTENLEIYEEQADLN